MCDRNRRTARGVVSHLVSEGGGTSGYIPPVSAGRGYPRPGLGGSPDLHWWVSPPSRPGLGVPTPPTPGPEVPTPITPGLGVPPNPLDLD